jgi:hypothetical protein
MADFRIGTTQANMTNIELLPVPLPVPRSIFRDFSEAVVAASGRSYGRGLPVCKWVFAMLTSAQRQQLKSYCIGLSAVVYIRTLVNDDQYYNYRAIMHWPIDEERDASKRRDRLEFEIEFTHLEKL